MTSIAVLLLGIAMYLLSDHLAGFITRSLKTDSPVRGELFQYLGLITVFVGVLCLVYDIVKTACAKWRCQTCGQLNK